MKSTRCMSSFAMVNLLILNCDNNEIINCVLIFDLIFRLSIFVFIFFGVVFFIIVSFASVVIIVVAFVIFIVFFNFCVFFLLCFFDFFSVYILLNFCVFFFNSLYCVCLYVLFRSFARRVRYCSAYRVDVFGVF